MDSYSVQARLSAVDDNYTSTLSKAIGLNDGLVGSIKRIAGGIGVYKLAAKGIAAVKSSLDGAIARFDTLNNFPKVMQSLGFSAEQSERSIKTLGDGIDGLPTTLDGIVQSAQMLTASLGDLDTASATAVALNDMFLAGGQGAEAAGRALTQYNQILAKGKVDMQSWNTMVEVAPGQMAQLAHTLVGATATQRDLYEALQTGKISMDEFNDAIIRLDQEGGEGFDSFANQARAATGGIATQLKNIKTAVVKGVEATIRTVNDMLEKLGLPTISEMLGKAKEAVKQTFNKINGAIAASEPVFRKLIMVAKTVINEFKLAFAAVKEAMGPGLDIDINPVEMARNAISKLGTVLRNVAKFIREHADAFAALIKALPVAIGLFAGFKVLGKVKGLFGGAKKAIDSVGKGVGNMAVNVARAIATIPPTTILAIGGALFMVAAGFALIATQSSGVAEIITAVGAVLKDIIISVLTTLGDMLPQLTAAITALAPVVTTAIAAIVPVVTEAVATLLPLITDFVTNVLPIITDAVTNIVQIVSDAVTTIVPPIVEAVTAIVEAVTSCISTIVPPITEAITSIVEIVVQGITDIVTALQPIVQSIGETIQGIADAVARVAESVAPSLEALGGAFESFGESVKTILDGVSEVVTAVGDSISGVLDSVAGIFDSMGNAALNAGVGVEKMAGGISNLVALSLADLAATLAAVADGLTSIGATSGGVDTVANAISRIKSAAGTMSSKLRQAASSITSMGSVSGAVATGITAMGTAGTTTAGVLTTAFNTIRAGAVALGTGIVSAMVSTSSRVVATVRTMTTNIMSALRSGISSAGSAFSAISTAASSAVTAAQAYVNSMYQVGVDIGNGLVRGLKSQQEAVRNIGETLGSIVEKATRNSVHSYSPSRTFISIGKDIGTGLVIGIGNMLGDVRDAGLQLAYATGFEDNFVARHDVAVNTEASFGDAMYKAMTGLADRAIEVNVPLYINGRQFAQATTSDITNEQGYQTRLNNWRTGNK